MRVKITSALHIFKDPVSAVCSMVKRYGREVTGECQICGFKGHTEIHHIISQPKIGRIKPGEHGHDLNLLKNPGNLAELCVPCHELTDSHIYRRTLELKESQLTGSSKSRNRPKRSPAEWVARNKRIAKQKRKSAETCKGMTKKSNFTKMCNHVIKETWPGDYCPQHEYQDPDPPEPKESPGLHDEGLVDAEEMAALVGISQGWMKTSDEYVRELFADWSKPWKRRWLYQQDPRGRPLEREGE